MPPNSNHNNNFNNKYSINIIVNGEKIVNQNLFMSLTPYFLLTKKYAGEKTSHNIKSQNRFMIVSIYLVR